MAISVSLCFYCKHRRPLFHTCEAFPDEVPLEVSLGYHDHRLPHRVTRPTPPQAAG